MDDPTTESALFAHAQQAFRWACRQDVAVRKPGNVSLASPGHDMVAAQFLASAEAAAVPLFCRATAVGKRIEAAVRATRAAAGCNTNLGIILLCAPLAAAGEGAGGADLPALQASLLRVLAGLGVDDARAAYRGIAQANPGGLGRAASQDVASEPTVDLRTAMGLAADRDLIARQYSTCFDDVLGRGLALFGPGSVASGRELTRRVQRLFVGLLAGHRDSHIARKFGDEAAQTVRTEAVAWAARLDDDQEAGGSAAFAAWDEALKARGLNPGTTADLTACTLFVAGLLEPRSLLHQADDCA